MGKNKAEEMQFWTKDEYCHFAEAIKEEPRFYAAFETLYYTGMRVGELTALYKSDIDTKAGVIRSISPTTDRGGRRNHRA